MQRQLTDRSISQLSLYTKSLQDDWGKYILAVNINIDVYIDEC